jgi:hypothetical protein
MIPAEVNLFMWGALSAASLTVSFFFLRFWRLSGERLFLFFTLAFVAFAINWAGLALAQTSDESRHYLYLVRLLAFVLILIGIVDKNRRGVAR